MTVNRAGGDDHARFYLKAPSRPRWEPAQGAAAKGEEGLSRQFETSPGRRNDYGDPSEVAANSNANGPGETVKVSSRFGFQPLAY
jgi:hypothetical protein